MVSVSQDGQVQKDDNEDDSEILNHKNTEDNEKSDNESSSENEEILKNEFVDVKLENFLTTNNVNNELLTTCLGPDATNLFNEYHKKVRTSTDKSWIRSFINENFENVPDSLKLLMYGAGCEGSIERDVSEKPEWLDLDKLRRGQTFARKHIYAVSYAELLSLFTLFSFPEGLKPLIITGNSGTPYTAFKRYLSTLIRVLNWYKYDHWTVGTPAYNDIVVVRKMHENVRKRIRESSREEYDKASIITNAWCPARSYMLEDFQSTCSVPLPGQCPYKIMGSGLNLFDHKPLSQGDMLATQFGFVGLLILYPKSFGLHSATDEDLEDFCHVWRSLGYLLGIEDEFNLCRGSLSDIRQRCKDFVEHWVRPNLREISPEWEHMMRCVIEGMLYYFPGSSYEVNLLYFTDLLDLHMPRLRNKLTFLQWIRYNLLKTFFKYLIRIPGVSYLAVKGYNRKVANAKKFSDDKLSTLQKRSEKTLQEYRKNLDQTMI